MTADGELRRIDHDNEADLFWAVRGGGGNYGVVTALEFELFPAPEIYAGSLFFPFERASEVMHAWHEFVAAGLPDEITTVGRLMQFPPLEEVPEMVRGKSFAILQAAYLGSEADGAELLRPLTDLGPEMNTFAMVEPNTLGYLAMDPEEPMPYVGSSRLVSNVSSAGIDAFLDASGPGSGSQLANVELRSLGGALGSPHPGARRARHARRRLPAVRRRRRVHAGRVRRGAAPGRGRLAGLAPGTPARATSTSRRASRRAGVLRRRQLAAPAGPADPLGPEGPVPRQPRDQGVVDR